MKSTKKTVMMSFILIFLLATMALLDSMSVEGQTQDVVYSLKMSVTYSNPGSGTKIWNLTEEDRMICLFMNNTWQTAYLINHSYPLEATKEDEDGNLIAVSNFPRLKLYPGENVSYTVVYRFLSMPRSLPDIAEERSGTLDVIPKNLSEKYCRGEGPWLVNDPRLRELAHSIAKNETRVLTIVKEFISWINQNITYTMREIPMYPNETYIERRGDCDDKAILFTTLCRIRKIPAYVQVGCIYMPTTRQNKTYWGRHLTSVQKQIGWHGWAIVYVPPWGWLPVDLTYVIGRPSEPLNAINAGAVTLQRTIQYMNISQTDYVASSRELREFVTNNNFYIYLEDEMTLETLEDTPDFPTPSKSPSDEIRKQPPSILVWVVTAAIGVSLTGTSMIVFVLGVRKAKKLKSDRAIKEIRKWYVDK